MSMFSYIKFMSKYKINEKITQVFQLWFLVIKYTLNQQVKGKRSILQIIL